MKAGIRGLLSIAAVAAVVNGAEGQGKKKGGPAAPPSPLTGLEAYVDSVRTAFAIPGMAVGIVKDDSLVFAKGFGLKEVGKPDLVDERTLFAIGSNTKSFTSLAAAILVDDGKLKW